MERIRRICDERGVRLGIISGVSSVNVVLARKGIDLAFTSFITLHTSRDIDMEEIVRHLKLGRIAIVFPKPYPRRPQEITRFLMSRRIRIYENITLENERISEYTLETLVAESRGFSDLSILVIYGLGQGSK